MKHNKSKILVLIDVKKDIESTLKSTVALAKIINGEIILFYVKKPTEVVNVDNQLSAMRGLNKDYTLLEGKIKTAINTVTKNHNISVNYSFSYGNIKNEIAKQIKDTKPDVIVLGKRKPKTVNFMGDKLTNHIINTFKGLVMVAPYKNVLEPNLALGVLKISDTNKNLLPLEIFLEHSIKNIRLFMLSKDINKTIDKESIIEANGKAFILEETQTTIKNLSTHIIQNNINLFFVNRASFNKTEKSVLSKKDIKNLIDVLEVPLLFGGSSN